MELPGKVAIVTGAASGIGKAIALRLGREGAAVVIADLDEARGLETVRFLAREGGRATFVHADVTRDADVRGMIERAEQAFGGLDILVNNAGGVQAPFYPEGSPEHWGHVLDVNLRAVMLAIQRALPALRRRGAGAVVNIASLAGVGYGAHDAPEYAAAKAGIVRLTAALAALSEENIRVNCLCPGWVLTPASRRTLETLPVAERRRIRRIVLEPARIAEAAVAFLRNEHLAGRVRLCPESGPWRLLPFGRRS